MPGSDRLYSRYSTFRRLAWLQTSLLLAFACLLLQPSHAKPAAPTTLTPENGVTAEVQKLDELNNYQLLQPDGSILILGRIDQLEVDDFNFDGHADLHVARTQGLNTYDQIYLYQPAEKHFALLKIPEDIQTHLLCDGFMNVLIFKQLDGSKILRSSCILKGADATHFEDFQFDTQGRLWIFRQYASLKRQLPETLLPYTDLPWGVTQMLTAFSPEGKVIQQQLTSRALEPITFKALTSGLALRDSPASEAKPVFSMPKNQVCNLIDFDAETLTLQLECRAANGQTYRGWLNWQEAIDKHTSARPFILTEIGSAKLY